MDRFSFFGILAGIVGLGSSLSYVIAILRGHKQPNRVTFWIWFAVSLLVFISFLKSGGTTVWLQLTFMSGPLMIAVLSLRYGEGAGLTRLDKGVVALSVVSIPLWIGLRSIFGDTPAAAVPVLLLNLFANFLGGVPTYLKVWHRPETEDKLAWILCVGSVVTNLFAVREWGVPDLVWNGYMICSAGFIALAACFRPSSVPVTQNG